MESISLVERLLAADALLTPDNWIQNHWFDDGPGTVCMCAHGAVQAKCNPEVQKALKSPNYFRLSQPLHGESARQALSVEGTSAVCEAARLADEAIRSGKSTICVWNIRPDWVRKDLVVYGVNHGNLDLHWLLGMVGLTAEYNDELDTTFDLIKEKFQQAIYLARELGV